MTDTALKPLPDSTSDTKPSATVNVTGRAREAASAAQEKVSAAAAKTVEAAKDKPYAAAGIAAGVAAAVAGGHARLTPGVPAPTGAVALHGPLMVCGFLGAVIGLERAAALGRLWAYAAPLAAVIPHNTHSCPVPRASANPLAKVSPTAIGASPFCTALCHGASRWLNQKRTTRYITSDDGRIIARVASSAPPTPAAW